ncbi:YbhB/YbcL family Raf kinase inhibitor-like protein [Aidingimonas lacisalsi]|uniref:YbhB/YbcL family Raf kinase inhibitor-like protein n=1 Tax=Aidingimonas lacisalsi TaxID=2604086 RepID=UPI0011D1CC43|nr:YbhB/YbcL family Raf kinase inhibitor-like protein [Aidingimonas lacisalsi]
MGFALSNMQVGSVSFENLGEIPTKHSGEGDDISPVLTWSGAPNGTQGYAVICHDPDAPLLKPGSYGFVHWVLYNLPASITHLAEGSTEGTTGGNDFGSTGYGGPMPPEGHGKHHYYFWVLALDQNLNLPAGLSLEAFLAEVEPHVLGMNRLIGTYERN